MAFPGFKTKIQQHQKIPGQRLSKDAIVLQTNQTVAKVAREFLGTHQITR